MEESAGQIDKKDIVEILMKRPSCRLKRVFNYKTYENLVLNLKQNCPTNILR